MSHGSGTERTVQYEYHSAMSQEESLMPGPRVSFPQGEQPSAKGKERATDEWPAQGTARHPEESNEQAANEQPTQSTRGCSDDTGLMRAMERMECRLHALMRGGLATLADNMSELERRITNVEGGTAPFEDDEQEDIDPLESDEWGRPPSDTNPAMGREPKADMPQGGSTPAQQYTGVRKCPVRADGWESIWKS